MQDVDVLMLMYIDDLCIFSDNVIDLQRKINVLSSYCSEYWTKHESYKVQSNGKNGRNGGVVKYNLKNCILTGH